MTDILKSMMTEEEYLEHYGVKGMKWGVTRDQAASGNKRAAKKLEKADRKWEKELHSTTGFVKVNNRMADIMNGPGGVIDKHNNNPKYKDKDLTKDSKLMDQYMNDFNKLSEKVFLKAVKDEYGESPSGKYTTSVDMTTGNISVVPNEIKHELKGDTLIFRVTRDAKGHVTKLIQDGETKLEHGYSGMMTEEEYLEHFGVKGMKWGKRKAEGAKSRSELRGLNKASRKADRAKNDADIDAARERYNSTARSNYKEAKATYNRDKHIIGKREAKKAFNAVKDKNLEDYYKGQEAKSGKETTQAVLLGIGGIALMTAASVLRNA